MQAIINGYGGIRIKSSYLEINPSLPHKVTTMNITGIKYRGAAFHLTVKQRTMTILQVLTTAPPIPFKIRISATKTDMNLVPGRSTTLNRQQIALMVVENVSRVAQKAATVSTNLPVQEPRRSMQKGTKPIRSEEKKPASSFKSLISPPKLPSQRPQTSIWALNKQPEKKQTFLTTGGKSGSIPIAAAKSSVSSKAVKSEKRSLNYPAEFSMEADHELKKKSSVSKVSVSKSSQVARERIDSKSSYNKARTARLRSLSRLGLTRN